MVIKRVSRRNRLLLILAVFVVVCFIPWERWFPLEIKDQTLQDIADYGLGFTALFLFTIAGVITLAKRFPNVRRALLYILLPLLSVGILYLGFIFSFVSRWGGWEDCRIYRNGNSYLVLELYEAPGDMGPEYSGMRLIITKSPRSMVRWNDAVYYINENKGSYVKAEKKLNFADKTWFTVADF